jgi:hypothetical protein
MHIKLRIYTDWYKSNKHTLIVNALDHECGVVTTYDLTLTFAPQKLEQGQGQVGPNMGLPLRKSETEPPPSEHRYGSALEVVTARIRVGRSIFIVTLT